MFSPKAFLGGGAKNAQKTATMRMSDSDGNVGFKMNSGSDDYKSTCPESGGCMERKCTRHGGETEIYGSPVVGEQVKATNAGRQINGRKEMRKHERRRK